MQNFRLAQSHVLRALEEARRGSGSTIALIGPVGSGKSYVLRHIADVAQDDALVVHFAGIDAPTPPLEPVYKGLFDAVSIGERVTAIGLELLKKYTKLIPGFGQYLDPVLSGLNHASASEALRRRGLSLSTSPATHVARMLREASKGRPVLLLCDDTDWLDDESWLCVTRLSDIAPDARITLVLTCSEDAGPRSERLEQLRRRYSAPPNNRWSFFQPEAWTVSTLPELCERLLSARCLFSGENYEMLFAASDGLPLYVESALRSLQRKGDLVIDEGIARPTGDWLSPDLDEGLRDILSGRILAAYREIAGSREVLEAASIFGSEFTDAGLADIAAVPQPFDILSKIETATVIVQYLLSQRHWCFTHSQLRKIVYDSLGGESASLHMKAAAWFQAREGSSPELIAHHLERGGSIGGAIEYKAQEADRLLDSGHFRSARFAAEYAMDLAERNGDTSDWDTRLRLIRVRSLFGERRFRDALGECKRLANRNETEPCHADILRWTRRCLLKLESQDAFGKSRETLETAADIYRRLGDLAAEADTLADLVVVLAHMNEYAKAAETFALAEALYNRLSDEVGMARLQRRNLMFLDPSLAFPIQRRLISTFEHLGLLHERIMAMNNSGSLAMYLEDLDGASELLSDAVPESMDLDGFGVSYLYNNLAIIAIVQGDSSGATEAIEMARLFAQRPILELIIDITDSVLTARQFGQRQALPALRAVHERSLRVGEYSYIHPATINYATALAASGNPSGAFNVLEQMPYQERATFAIYKHSRWYDLKLRLLYDIGDQAQADHFAKEYALARGNRDGSYAGFPYAFSSTQFWSD